MLPEGVNPSNDRVSVPDALMFPEDPLGIVSVLL